MVGWIRKTIAVALPLAAILALTVGCDRNVAPFEEEEPSQPDLGNIFPDGAKRAAEAPPQVPPDLGAARGNFPAAPGPAGDPVSGTITLAEGMSAPPGSVLFIIARRGDTGPPLAVKRIMDASFPLDFELGPDDRMIQAMPFEGPFNVSARIDGDGNAMSRNPGDLQGAVATPVDPGASGLQLVVDQKL
jgi:hypothetical protein